MKAGVIDIFAESFGWVLGKAVLFALAVMAGVGIGACGLWAGTAVGMGELHFKSGGLPIQQHLSVVTAILPQVLVVFWAGMVFVRSEKAGPRHWVTVVALEALVLTACFTPAIPGGLLGCLAAWFVATALITGTAVATLRLERWQMKRGIDHLDRLQQANEIRRQELKTKFGTESVGARDLGIL